MTKSFSIGQAAKATKASLEMTDYAYTDARVAHVHEQQIAHDEDWRPENLQKLQRPLVSYLSLCRTKMTT